MKNPNDNILKRALDLMAKSVATSLCNPDEVPLRSSELNAYYIKKARLELKK